MSYDRKELKDLHDAFFKKARYPEPLQVKWTTFDDTMARLGPPLQAEDLLMAMMNEDQIVAEVVKGLKKAGIQSDYKGRYGDNEPDETRTESDQKA